jgi:hypothetical protein
VCYVSYYVVVFFKLKLGLGLIPKKDQGSRETKKEVPKPTHIGEGMDGDEEKIARTKKEGRKKGMPKNKNKKGKCKTETMD